MFENNVLSRQNSLVLYKWFIGWDYNARYGGISFGKKYDGERYSPALLLSMIMNLLIRKMYYRPNFFAEDPPMPQFCFGTS